MLIRLSLPNRHSNSRRLSTLSPARPDNPASRRAAASTPRRVFSECQAEYVRANVVRFRRGAPRWLASDELCLYRRRSPLLPLFWLLKQNRGLRAELARNMDDR